MTVNQAAVIVALKTVVDYVDSLEARVRQLQVTTARIAGDHLRDEDVQLEVIRVGDRLRVGTTVLWQEFVDLSAAGLTTTPVLVQQIRIEDDGTKTLIVGPKGPTV
jgi:hypothetical protein